MITSFAIYESKGDYSISIGDYIVLETDYNIFGLFYCIEEESLNYEEKIGKKGKEKKIYYIINNDDILEGDIKNINDIDYLWHHYDNDIQKLTYIVGKKYLMGYSYKAMKELEREYPNVAFSDRICDFIWKGRNRKKAIEFYELIKQSNKYNL
jgi:hypothetical protein